MALCFSWVAHLFLPGWRCFPFALNTQTCLIEHPSQFLSFILRNMLDSWSLSQFSWHKPGSSSLSSSPPSEISDYVLLILYFSAFYHYHCSHHFFLFLNLFSFLKICFNRIRSYRLNSGTCICCTEVESGLLYPSPNNVHCTLEVISHPFPPFPPSFQCPLFHSVCPCISVV